MTDRDRTVTMLGILTAMLLAALDQSILTPAMPTIGGDLGDAHYLPWVVTIYLLTATAVAPLFGRYSDVHGRRVTIYIALALFQLGSIAAALAPNMFALIAARGIQGVGGGGIFAMSQILIGDLFPPRERMRYSAWIAGMWAIASIAGPLLGGTFAEYHWQLIFWINIPLGLVAVTGINGPLKRLSTVRHSHRLDGIGAVLLVVATSTLLLMLNWAGTVYPWTSPQIIGLAAVSFGLWVAFAIRLGTAGEPLISLGILSNPIVLCGSFAMFLVSAANVGMAVIIPIYAQGYLGLSPAFSGYVLLGFFLGSVVGAATSGRLTRRIERIKRIGMTGTIMCGLALIATGLLAANTSVVLLEILLAVVGAGMGLAFPVTTVSVQNGVDPHHMGAATGVLIFLRSLGSALGVAVMGAIAVGHGIPLGAETGSETIAAITDPSGFSVLYYTMATVVIAASVFYVAMPHKTLRGHTPAPVVE